LIDYHGLTDSVESLMHESWVLFFELAGDRLAPMPGLFELLAHIERRGLPMAVATSSRRTYLEEILGRFDLLDRFDFTLAAEDVTHGKPHPEIYLTAAARLGISPGEMLVLEDSHAGSKAGASAGAVVVAVPNDHSRYQDFSHSSRVASRLDDACVLQLL
jgi:HAD superfamily hydrolase (TIGR01509 family)